ncbi:MAG TPA: DUF2207 domain-containing protein [Candidatus Saccharimonadales bacterium]|nr:DUF2207 domain-containing protein [Candidatus Saccharimonadales bacterium]
MQRIRAFFAAFGSAGLLLLLFPVAVHADVNNFTVTDFSADYTLTSADKQGQLHVIEKIAVAFTDNNHGILRALPDTYLGNPLKLHINGISSASGAPTQYSTYSQNGNTVLKIGDPNRTVTGTQEYTIDYSMQNVVSFYNDHDEFYWNVNGNQWQQPFTHISATIHLPEGLGLNGQPVCYADYYGGLAQPCTITSNGNALLTQTTRPLAARQTLSFKVAFNKGFFTAPTTWDKLRDYLGLVAAFTVLPLLAFVVGFTAWLKKGRDAKEPDTIIPEYEPPDNLTPLEVGTLVDFKVDNRDITATIIQLAVRGYIRIIETVKDRALLPDETIYSLQLLNDNYTSLTNFEAAIMLALFKDATLNDTIDLSKSANKMYAVSLDVSKTVEQELTSKGYFRANPLKSGRVLGWGATTVVVIIYIYARVANNLSVLPFFVGGVVAAFIAGFFANIMAARTAQGVVSRNKILGLKLYMDVAEKNRLEKLQGPNAAYADNAGEPVKTVDLFEKLLPYAIVLQVEKGWAKKFEGLYTSPPNWYAGNTAAFNAGYLAGSLGGGFQNSVSSAFTAPGGGAGGGGAGGGGGGGGGGGW